MAWSFVFSLIAIYYKYTYSLLTMCLLHIRNKSDRTKSAFIKYPKNCYTQHKASHLTTTRYKSPWIAEHTLHKKYIIFTIPYSVSRCFKTKAQVLSGLISTEMRYLNLFSSIISSGVVCHFFFNYEQRSSPNAFNYGIKVVRH